MPATLTAVAKPVTTDPDPNKGVLITVQAPQWLKTRAQHAAKKRGQDLSGFVRELIRVATEEKK